MSIILNELLEEPNPYTRYCKRIEQIATEEEATQLIGEYSKTPDYQLFADTFIELIKDTKGRSFNELEKYRRCIPKLLRYIEEIEKNCVYYQWCAWNFGLTDKMNKKWTKEEDEFLIEQMSKDEPDEMSVISALRRTPSAVRQRLTYLVGVKRLSQKIAGKFIGEINGKQSEATIVGTVYKGGEST